MVATFLVEMWTALKAIMVSPFTDLSIWWLLAPVVLLWIIMELYFGKFKKEKLGWNTSLTNAVSLAWVGIESMRFLFSTKPEAFWFRFSIISIIIIYAAVIVYFAFSHTLSGKVTYLLASPTPIYYLSSVTILWGHGVLIITLWVLIDLIILFGIVGGAFILLKKFMPESEKDEGEGLETTETPLGTSASSDLGDMKF